MRYRPSWCRCSRPQVWEEAHQRAKQLEPQIREFQNRGYSRNRIAAELNKCKVPTPRGGRWDHSSVRNVNETPYTLIASLTLLRSRVFPLPPMISDPFTFGKTEVGESRLGCSGFVPKVYWLSMSARDVLGTNSQPTAPLIARER